MESTLISLRDVKISFDDLDLIHNVSFEIKAGEKVSLLGPGGSGKSTILKAILGLLKPRAGAIELLGQDMVEGDERSKREILKQVGMAFQQGALFDFMTVRENLSFAMEHMTQRNPDEMDAKIIALLAGVKLPHTENMYPFELSGGMQRRVGIARALCTDPIMAIFDEPTAGLDPVTSTIILNMIRDLLGDNNEGAQMVVTSNVEIGVRFADRILVLNEGTIVADGPWRELLVQGPEWVRHFLGVRFIGLDLDYAQGLDLPQSFIDQHWSDA